MLSILENYIAISYIRRHFRNEKYEQEKKYNTQENYQKETKYFFPHHQDFNVKCLTLYYSCGTIRVLRVLWNVGKDSGLPGSERNS